MARATLKRSRYLTAALGCAHLSAFATLIPLELALQSKLLLSLAIVASLAHSLWRFAFLRSPRSVIALELKDRETAIVQQGDETWHEGKVLGTSYVSPLLTVVNLRLDGHRLTRHIVVVPDNIDPEEFRKLRVTLRWSYPKQPPSHLVT